MYLCDESDGPLGTVWVVHHETPDCTDHDEVSEKEIGPSWELAFGGHCNGGQRIGCTKNFVGRGDPGDDVIEGNWPIGHGPNNRTSWGEHPHRPEHFPGRAHRGWHRHPRGYDHPDYGDYGSGEDYYGHDDHYDHDDHNYGGDFPFSEPKYEDLLPEGFELTSKRYADPQCTMELGETFGFSGAIPFGCDGNHEDGFVQYYCDPYDAGDPGPASGTLWVALHQEAGCSDAPSFWFPVGSGTCEPDEEEGTFHTIGCRVATSDSLGPNPDLIIPDFEQTVQVYSDSNCSVGSGATHIVTDDEVPRGCIGNLEGFMSYYCDPYTVGEYGQPVGTIWVAYHGDTDSSCSNPPMAWYPATSTSYCANNGDSFGVIGCQMIGGGNNAGGPGTEDPYTGPGTGPNPLDLLPDGFEVTSQAYLDDICTLESGDALVVPGVFPSGCSGSAADGFAQFYCDPYDDGDAVPTSGTVWQALHNDPQCNDEPTFWFPVASGSCDGGGGSFSIMGCRLATGDGSGTANAGPDPANLAVDFDFTEQMYTDDICTLDDGGGVQLTVDAPPPGCSANPDNSDFTQYYCDPFEPAAGAAGPASGTVWAALHALGDCSDEPQQWFPVTSGACEPSTAGPGLFTVRGCQLPLPPNRRLGAVSDSAHQAHQALEKVYKRVQAGVKASMQ
ncbi:unnamed protein product [Chrysoparadoxa australica]